MNYVVHYTYEYVAGRSSPHELGAGMAKSMPISTASHIVLCIVDWRGSGVWEHNTSKPHCPELTSLRKIYTPTPFQTYSYSGGGRTSCFVHLRQHYGVRPLNQSYSVHLLEEKTIIWVQWKSLAILTVTKVCKILNLFREKVHFTFPIVSYDTKKYSVSETGSGSLIA